MKQKEDGTHYVMRVLIYTTRVGQPKCRPCEGTGKNEDGIYCKLCDGTGLMKYEELDGDWKF